MSNEVCEICPKKINFRLVTEDYKPIKTENNLYYIDDNRIIYMLIKKSAPIPVWTNNYGNSVNQLGAVLIGGENGLNS